MAAYGATLQVHNFKQVMQAIAKTDKATQKAFRDEIRKAGEDVKHGSTILFMRYDARSAAGYRTIVRQRGVTVEQSKRRTTGKHPEFAALQLRRALRPSLYANEPRTRRALEQAIDRICARFNAGGF